MAELTKKDKQLDWACRIMFTLSFFVVANGYLSFVQARQQLVSPLIPRSTLYDIADASIRTSLVACVLFIAGLWFYSFNRKIAALVLWGLTALVYQLLLMQFRK